MASRRRYSERDLCPRRVPLAWWYSLPSVTRGRIVAETGIPVAAGDAYVGQVQDALLAGGHRQMASRFMRAMQDCLDREKAEDEERDRVLRHEDHIGGYVTERFLPSGVESFEQAQQGLTS